MEPDCYPKWLGMPSGTVDAPTTHEEGYWDLLQIAAELGDESLFLSATRHIDWLQRTSTEFTQAVRFALSSRCA